MKMFCDQVCPRFECEHHMSKGGQYSLETGESYGMVDMTEHCGKMNEIKESKWQKIKRIVFKK